MRVRPTSFYADAPQVPGALRAVDEEILPRLRAGPGEGYLYLGSSS